MNGLMKIEAEQDLGRPPVLFVHGAWHGAWCWRPLMEHFAAAGFTSYALDLPGHGERQGEGVAGLGLAEYAAEVEKAVESLAPADPVLVGHSMGGIIVQKHLENHNAPAALLVAPCPAGGAALSVLFKYSLHQFGAGLDVLLGQTNSITGPAMCRRLFFHQAAEENVRAHYVRLGRESSRAVRQMVIPGLKVKAAPPRSGTPVAVASAGFDYFFGHDQLKAWADRSGFDFLSFPDLGHNLMSVPEFRKVGDVFIDWIMKTAVSS